MLSRLGVVGAAVLLDLADLSDQAVDAERHLMAGRLVRDEGFLRRGQADVELEL